MTSDGCTGFQWAEWLFDIRSCCVAHDFGGSDGALLDCLLNNTPAWLGVPVILAVALMYALRPIVRKWRNRDV